LLTARALLMPEHSQPDLSRYGRHGGARGCRSTFQCACQPTGEELNRLLFADPEHPSLDWVPDSSFDHLQAVSVSYRIAIGPHARRKA